MSSPNSSPGLTPLGKVFVLLLIGALCAGGYMLFNGKRSAAAPSDSLAANGQAGGSSADGNAPVPQPAVSITFAFGSEKERWLRWAAGEFAKTGPGAGVRMELKPIGSLESARKIASEGKGTHLWSPASTTVRDILATDWQQQHGTQAFLREESLALSPMVFISWQDRYAAFSAKFGKMNFDTVAAALNETTGWGGIAGKPEWGFFKFGCPDPMASNGGLTTIAMMGHHFLKKTQMLTTADVVNAGFQEWFGKTAAGFTGLSGSTGTMMKEMVLKGPSAYDAIFAYENVAIDYLKGAEGRWGRLQVTYPALNMWSEHPCCLLNAEGMTTAQKTAASAFMDFLLSPVAQRQAVEHGFRPANPDVPMIGPESPWTKYADHGLQVEIPQVCAPPQAEAVLNLLTGWQRLKNR